MQIKRHSWQDLRFFVWTDSQSNWQPCAAPHNSCCASISNNKEQTVARNSFHKIVFRFSPFSRRESTSWLMRIVPQTTNAKDNIDDDSMTGIFCFVVRINSNREGSLALHRITCLAHRSRTTVRPATTVAGNSFCHIVLPFRPASENVLIDADRVSKTMDTASSCTWDTWINSVLCRGSLWTGSSTTQCTSSLAHQSRILVW
jgi:hypothetical protein